MQGARHGLTKLPEDLAVWQPVKTQIGWDENSSAGQRSRET